MRIFDKKEVRYYLITILILAFVFGFNDKAASFEISHWINNFFMVLIVVIISFLLGHAAHKTVAQKFYAKSEYNLWMIKRFGFAPHMKTRVGKREFTIPGLIFPIMVTLVSNGLWYFPVVGTYNLIEEHVKRTGKIFTKLTGYERGVIYLAAPLTNLILFFIFLFVSKTYPAFGIFVSVNLWLALFGLLPLPGLIGAEILFGSLPLYFFILVLFIVSALVAPVNMILAMILALVLAILVTMMYIIQMSKG